MLQDVRVRVPATTANLGPGFDCLGVALRLFNTTRVRRGGTASDPMVLEAADAFFARAKCRPFSFGHSISGDVPISRGLGSSVTVRLGVLLGLNAMCGDLLDSQAIFELCTDLEGHPDNAAPAVFGGFCASRNSSALRFAVSSALTFVLLIPPYEVRTDAARKVLPPTLDRQAAVLSTVNACRITAAFASKDYASLAGAFEDGLHQPYRASLVRELAPALVAGMKAGALGGFLSGSGSTIACVTLRDAERVARAMKRAASSPDARVVVTHADNRGARIVKRA